MLAVGGAVLVAGSFVVPGVIVPVLTLVAGAVVLVLGLRLVHTRWAVPAPSRGHGHEGQLLTRPSLRSVAAMGVTAGMIPCPEALGVLLLAIGLQRTALGLLMIVAFSVGLGLVRAVLGGVMTVTGLIGLAG